LAARVARAGGAAEGRTIHDTRRLACARAVARPRRVEPIPRARRRHAHRLRPVHRAAAEAVARPRLAALRGAAVLAHAAGVGVAVVDGPAGALAAHLVARRAGALARVGTADAVGAEARRALLVLVAVRALHLGTTAAHDAGVAGRAVRVRLAGREAGRLL